MNAPQTRPQPKSETAPAQPQPQIDLESIEIAPGRGAVVRSLSDAFALADAYSRAGVLPQVGYDRESRKPLYMTREQAAIAIEAGAAVGLPAMMSVRVIAIINNRATLHSEGIAAVCGLGRDVSETVVWRAGGVELHDGDVMGAIVAGEAVTCEVQWERGGKAAANTFGVADAVQAGLWTIGKADPTYGDKVSPWYRFPRNMLYASARRAVARRLCADRLLGLDVGEVVDGVVVGESVPDLSTRAASEIRRPQPKRSTVTPAPAVDSGASPDSAPGPDRDPQPGRGEQPTVPPPPSSPPRLISEAQRTRLWALAGERWPGDKAAREKELREIIQLVTGQDSSAGIAARDYDEICRVVQLDDEAYQVWHDGRTAP